MGNQNTEENSKELAYKAIAISAISNFNKEVENIRAGIKSDKAKFKFNKKGVIYVYDRNIYNSVMSLKKKIEEDGYQVEFDEYIDKKNITKETKYVIRISDVNNSYIDISYFDYRNIMLDYT